MKYFFLLLAVIVIFLQARSSHSQTVPVADTLATDSLFTFYGFSNSADTIYPLSIGGWAGAAQDGITGAPTDGQATADLKLKPNTDNIVSGSFRNEGTSGISFKTSTTGGTPQALVIALSTIGMPSLTESWYASCNNVATGVVASVQLQYRVGNTGAWTNVDTSNYQVSQASSASKKFPTRSLPDSLLNRPLVELRWLSWETSMQQNVYPFHRFVIDSIIITVKKPLPGFSSSVSSLTATFTDTSKNAPSSWLWNFGDNTTSTLKNPSHQYATAGTYTVKLKARNAGGVDSSTHTVAPVNPTVKPAVKFGYSINSFTVSFTDSSTNSPNKWLWDFGDGATDTVKNPVHTYSASGTYNVKLKATNVVGSDSLTKSIVLAAAPIARYGYSANKLAVAFSDSSLNSPTSWLWDFGDTTTSTLENPSHTYAQARTYTVQLKATNSLGSDSVTKSVTIDTIAALRPAANFGYSSNGLIVAFVDSSMNSPTSWLWDFGDTTTSTLENPSHPYTHRGPFLVKLVARNSVGQDSITKTVTVDTIVSVTEQADNRFLAIDLYPNPVNDILSLLLPKQTDEVLTIEIYNQLGLMMRSVRSEKGMSRLDMNVKTFSVGVYILRIILKEETFALGRFIIVR